MITTEVASGLLGEMEHHLAALQALAQRVRDLPGGLAAQIAHLYGAPLATTAEMWDRCRCHPNRRALLAALPRGGVAVEVGTQRGEWARVILDVLQPERLFTIDSSYGVFHHESFATERASGRLVLLEGSSWDRLAGFEDASLDMIYIDAGHRYAEVSRDAAVAVRKLKRDGTLVFNDFGVFSPVEFMPYGVARAAIETARDHEMVFTHFAHDYLGYHDIALKFAWV